MVGLHHNHNYQGVLKTSVKLCFFQHMLNTVRPESCETARNVGGKQCWSKPNRNTYKETLFYDIEIKRKLSMCQMSAAVFNLADVMSQ